MHEDELDVTEDLVRRLVARDAPSFADEPIRPLAATGSTNIMFRLGDTALVRIPRQPGGSESIAAESRWVPALRNGLSVSVPELLVVGEPGFGYPERWSVVRWLEGDHPPVPAEPGEPLARDLARLVRELSAIEVSDAAVGDTALHSYRAGSLATVDGEIRAYLDQCRSLPDLRLDLDACERLWTEAMALSGPPHPPRHWLHGDLLAENLLVRDGRLRAVLDFGALAVGDPCVDLVVSWEVLTPADRATFRAALDVDETTWLRGRAWGLAIALMTFPYYWHSMPGRCADRLALARAVLDDDGRSSDVTS